MLCDSSLDVHALGVLVLLVAGIHRHPGVGVFIDSATAGGVVYVGFDPDVFEFDGFDQAAAHHADVGDAASILFAKLIGLRP